MRGQYDGYLDEPGVRPNSDTETFVALKCEIDNWRWADVPFYLRTGKRMAESARIISIAFREPPKSMFPTGSGVGAHGPDHLTFDLADVSKLSLSFYGKRPGPGMKLDKQSLQFSLHETGRAGDVLEAYERLIYDAMCGDHTLFSSADGIESLWERSAPLLESPPPVRPYRPGSWGPNAIHQLIAPNAWRLPFERAWRDSCRPATGTIGVSRRRRRRGRASSSRGPSCVAAGCRAHFEEVTADALHRGRLAGGPDARRRRRWSRLRPRRRACRPAARRRAGRASGRRRVGVRGARWRAGGIVDLDVDDARRSSGDRTSSSWLIAGIALSSPASRCSGASAATA